MTDDIPAVPGSRLLVNEDAREDAPVRLFAFTSHNSSVHEFAGWSARLPMDLVECYVVRPILSSTPSLLPARPGFDVEAQARHVLDGLVNEILLHMDKPFVFFGRSLGAHVASALALELEFRGLPQPRRLLVSAVEPLYVAGGSDGCAAVPGAWLAGAAPGATSTLEAEARLLAGLRATIKGAGATLTCPLTVFTCDGEDVLSSWAESTSGSCSCSALDATLPANESLLQRLEEVVREDVRASCAESTALIQEWNSGTFLYPDTVCLHELFAKSAAVFPDDTAVVYRNQSLTFAELDELTDLLAAWLYAAGVRVGTAVGIFMEHCAEYVVAYIAAHKAGGAYMPIETVYPQDLLRRVCEDAKPVVVLTKASFASRLPPEQMRLRMDGSNAESDWRSRAAAAPALPCDRVLPTPDDLAYIVMSSGTTGAPKGICCPHRGAVHSYYYRLVTFPYEPGEREACHVFFVWELLRPLLAGLKEAGGTPVPLYVIPDDAIYNPVLLVQYLQENAITRVLFTPSLLQLVLDTVPAAQAREALSKLRIVWLCGEVVTSELRNRFVALLPRCRLENLYSISECHDISYANLNELNTRESPKFAPCGKVIPNVRAYVLDDNFKPVPVGVPGRMFVAGPCLAIGYLNMPEKTAERFVPCPFGGGRMYDTGDRCRYLSSGSIEVLGRCDFMVKIRGYSVVVGAVETAIAEHPLVSTACVLTEGAEGAVEKRLVAYVVPERWEEVPTLQSVQSFLKARLPPYAVPSTFILLDAIPINMASGKLDRRRLPPSASAKTRLMPSSRDGADLPAANGIGGSNGLGKGEVSFSGALATSTERTIAKLWGSLLQLEEANIRRCDDFFDLGGHSLLITRLASSVAAHPSFGIDLPVADVLLHSTLADLAAHVDSLVAVGAGVASSSLGPVGVAAASAAGAIAPTAPSLDCVDLAAEAARLDPSIFPAPTRKAGYARFRAGEAAAPPRRVLLTGATGFLGAHILAALLADTPVEVYCIVRAADSAAAASRIEESLANYGLWDGEVAAAVEAGRAVPVAGDLAQPLLGLGRAEFKALACELDSIIHCGAAVNLVRSYHSLKATNVLGTQEVLRLAVTNGFGTRVKPVHFVSTNGVFPLASSDAALSKTWTEDADLSQLWPLLADGYAQSKWVAERLCLEARARGLPVSVLRPGNLSPSSGTGIWNSADFYYLLLAGCVAVGAAPDCAHWRVDMTPVDFAARAIVHVAVRSPGEALGRVMHVQHPRQPVPFLDVVSWVAASCCGAELPLVPLAEFRARVVAAAAAAAEESVERDGPQPATGSKILAGLAAGLDSFERYMAGMGVMDAANLQAALEGTGIECPVVDSQYCSGLAVATAPVPPRH